MGYSHFWRRTADLDRRAFSKAAEEIKLIIENMSGIGIPIAGPTGQGKPELTEHTIAFNGAADCGHRYRDLGKPYPSDTAEGVLAKEPPYDASAEPWFSGALLQTRACGGNCAGGPFILDRVYLKRDWERAQGGMFFCFCETQYKPYDLAITAALIRLKENLGGEILVSSDGEDRGFEDAKRFCREIFGWAKHFELEPSESEVV